jgi:hypothetical protein
MAERVKSATAESIIAKVKRGRVALNEMLTQ